MAGGQHTRQDNRGPKQPNKNKNTTRFRPYMRVKLVVFCILVAALLLFLIGNLIYITSTSEGNTKNRCFLSKNMILPLCLISGELYWTLTELPWHTVKRFTM